MNDITILHRNLVLKWNILWRFCMNCKCGTFTIGIQQIVLQFNRFYVWKWMVSMCQTALIQKACWHNKHARTLTHHISPERESKDGHMSQEVDQGIWLLDTPWPNAKHFSSIHWKLLAFGKTDIPNSVCSFTFPTDLYWHTDSTQTTWVHLFFWLPEAQIRHSFLV